VGCDDSLIVCVSAVDVAAHKHRRLNSLFEKYLGGTDDGCVKQGRTDCGMLKVGMDADIALVDFSAPHLIPCHDVVSSLVFSAKGGDVAMTMVRGKILYQNGRFTTIDLNEVVQEMMEYAIPKVLQADSEA
jgi:cytosine/adenosine deaminase-related metal-dependent hydrolase